MFLGNTVTVMSPEGKPIQVNASALQAAAAQNAIGRLSNFHWRMPKDYSPELSIVSNGCCLIFNNPQIAPKFAHEAYKTKVPPFVSLTILVLRNVKNTN